MRKVLLPNGISGSSKDYPYLARLIPRFKYYSAIILLITEEKQMVLLGKYTGPRDGILDRYYTPGYIVPNNERVPEVYLLPLNKGRL
jgi:hypothetical protein